METKTETEPEVRENGIYFALGGPYGILMVKSWGLDDYVKFTKADRVQGLRLLIERTVDWNIPDLQWNPIPFEKEKLLARLDAYAAQQLQTSQELNQLLLTSLTKLAAEHPAVAEAYDRIKNLLTQSEGLVEQAKRLVQADAGEMFVIPTALQSRLALAYLRCYIASFNVPFESLLPSSQVPESTATATAPNS